MIERIERIAVLGSGRMASGIATLFANAGIPTLVFDLRQEALEAQMADLKNQQGDLYLQTEDSALITPCNYQDHLGRLHETDWVIEAVTDDATVKKGLFFKILPFLNPGTFLSSTSAFLSHSSLCEGMPSEFCDYFVLTQFHFPPEQSNLLELVTGEDSLPEVAATLSHFCRTVLGREVVTTSDTPGLILNRLRTFDILNTFVAARDHEISLATADYLTGAFLGRPEGVFSHADRIGIDFVALSALHFLEKCVNDPNRNAFRLPDALLWLVDKENFGRKSGRGFFGVEENLQFDPQELKYVPRPANPEGQTGILPYLQSIPDRLRSLATGNSREAAFLWQALSRLLLYAANQIPDNAATLVETDRVMRYGLSWPHGPFELWDILGLENTLQRMGQDGLSIPAWLEAMPEGGHRHFYSTRQQEPHFFDVHYGEPSPILHDPGHISLSRIRQRPAVYENWNASLHEVGEGLLCLVMHPITGPPAGMLDPAVLEVAEAALNIIPKEGYRGLLLTTDGEDFSNGAYHEMLLQFCRSERWEDLELWSRQFQEITQQLRYAPFPVVAAVSGRLIGPGLELAMACDKVVAHGHLQAGFEGLRCGLSPFGGGTVRLLGNSLSNTRHQGPDILALVESLLTLLISGRITRNAREAHRWHLLRDSDLISMDRNNLLGLAHQTLKVLSEDYQPPTHYPVYQLPGQGGLQHLRQTLSAKFPEEGDRDLIRVMAEALAPVLTSSSEGEGSAMSETHLLEQERRAFLQLCREKTVAEHLHRRLILFS